MEIRSNCTSYFSRDGIKKIGLQYFVKQWSAEIEATNHASISYILLDPVGTTLHLAGIAHGNVDGNSLIGEQDDFIAKLNSTTGEVQ